jgi:hypothetical protein
MQHLLCTGQCDWRLANILSVPAFSGLVASVDLANSFQSIENEYESLSLEVASAASPFSLKGAGIGTILGIK